MISKSFLEFLSIKEYCQAYQETYDEIASQSANKNKYYHQDKAYKVFLQDAILDKLPKSYAPFTFAIDKDWKNYTYDNLSNTINKVTHYLKTNPLKIFHIISNANSGKAANPNKQR